METKTAWFILAGVLLGGFLVALPRDNPVNTEKRAEVLPTEFITDKFWYCFSKDGRINYVPVISAEKPLYLPSAGNEKIDFYCNHEELINMKTYKPQ